MSTAPEGARFDVQPLVRPRSRVPLAGALWIGAIAVMVALGTAGHGPAGPSGPPTANEASTTGDPGLRLADAASPGPRPVPAGVSSLDVIDLRTPRAGPIVVSTHDLPVDGVVFWKAARVEISLEGLGTRVLASAVVNLLNADGEMRLAVSPTFEASFDLPSPRPTGTVWVVVRAFDTQGAFLGSTMRTVTIGKLRPTPPWLHIDRQLVLY
jgi:hypothetical protein